MNNIKKDGFSLIGLKLGHKTTNEAEQSGIDCGTLWQKFETEGVAEQIPGKLDNAIYAVYFDYEGDHTKPYSYFIGCRVDAATDVPKGMDSLVINGGNYSRITAKGKMPDCVADAWRGIWKSKMTRAYRNDFEIYDERSKDWSRAEVDIFVGE
jgi:predicted transcriptional regulator YdeE